MPGENIASGRPPQQWNDIKQQIIAALADLQCNGKIYLLGASSGGTHAAWCALDPTPLPPGASGWPLTTGTIKAVAGLSGVYDLSYHASDASPTFRNDVANYTNTALTDYTTQYGKSPISLVATATNIPPFLLFTTATDPVPYELTVNMAGALVNKGASAQYYIIPGSDHAFHYWHTSNPMTPGDCVSNNVIDFFNSHP